MSATTAVIIQARWGSSRLPGKVLEKLGQRTVLEHVVARAQQIEGADVVVVATPDSASSDAVAAEALRCGAVVHRGSEHDVLSRYLGAARAVSADIVMRITSDCPLIDPQICARVLALRSTARADYATNNMPPTYPHGLDCEAFTTNALDEADRTSQEPYDREHVTPWLRRAPHLKRVNLAAPHPSTHLHRWTLDYPEDLAFLRALLGCFPEGALPGTADIEALLHRRPDLSRINSQHAQVRTSGPAH